MKKVVKKCKLSRIYLYVACISSLTVKSIDCLMFGHNIKPEDAIAAFNAGKTITSEKYDHSNVIAFKFKFAFRVTEYREMDIDKFIDNATILKNFDSRRDLVTRSIMKTVYHIDTYEMGRLVSRNEISYEAMTEKEYKKAYYNNSYSIVKMISCETSLYGMSYNDFYKYSKRVADK